MSSKEVGIEQARKTLGDLADAAHHHGEIAYLTRHGRPIAAIVPVNRVAKEPVMRTVYSTVDRVDPTVTREIADAVQEAIENGHVERESYSSEDGQRDTWIRVVSFELDGQQRFAMAHEDPAEAEVIDSTDRAEIEALYEKQVRDLVNISEWEFDESDVDMASPADITVTLDRSGEDDGWNWAEAATEQWVKAAKDAGFKVEVISHQTPDENHDAALVGINGRSYLISVHGDEVTAERSGEDEDDEDR